MPFPDAEPNLELWAILAITRPMGNREHDMQRLSAKDAKYNFGRLIDLARVNAVTVEKHGRPVVVVLAVEEYERLKEVDREVARGGKSRKSEK